ncbi:MAG: Re/Si-specific NAD(P)(+) transhydrogenase subunit alpha [Alphaproteobacteria bacterium]|nr:Re/Si-specific NAD(P)(+) transhydrogenase subunit alpha [Alphaproteobacteria bacterium]MBN9498038.1 Re/Si-specific NAD(P)(+) transhydrogenase subunit alpha [Alphaproteobacteria bacterium]
MKVAIPKERRAYEARVATTPDAIKRMKPLGLTFLVEAGAGLTAAIPDQAFVDAGAEIVSDNAALLAQADIVLKVARPLTAAEGTDELAAMKSGTVLISQLDPYRNREQVADYAKRGIVAVAMELVPRITRAQSMDVLSSQANLAGYKAVIDAAEQFGRAFPMMMTAAGTVAPAKVMVMGAGVAGLQAIATARRLGAVVSATDVRLAAKEQVESLGATFVFVDDEEARQAETSGGYAKEMSDAYKAKQAALIAETIKKMDVVICTAQIPGRPAPRLVTDAMVASMKPGSIVVDLAVETGGNCEGSEVAKIVVKHGVKIVGYANVPSRLAVDASSLYARNLAEYLKLIVQKDGTLKLDREDEIVKGSLLTQDGQIVHAAFAPAPAAAQ